MNSVSSHSSPWYQVAFNDELVFGNGYSRHRPSSELHGENNVESLSPGQGTEIDVQAQSFTTRTVVQDQLGPHPFRHQANLTRLSVQRPLELTFLRKKTSHALLANARKEQRLDTACRKVEEWKKSHEIDQELHGENDRQTGGLCKDVDTTHAQHAISPTHLDMLLRLYRESGRADPLLLVNGPQEKEACGVKRQRRHSSSSSLIVEHYSQMQDKTRKTLKAVISKLMKAWNQSDLNALGLQEQVLSRTDSATFTSYRAAKEAQTSQSPPDWWKHWGVAQQMLLNQTKKH